MRPLNRQLRQILSWEGIWIQNAFMELITTENTKKIENIGQAPTKCPAGWFSPVLKRLLDHQTEETWVETSFAHGGSASQKV